MKESDIQSQIINYLQILEKQGKLFFQRINNTAIYDPVGKRWRSLAKGTKKGFPDILVLKDSKCIGLEVKTIKRAGRNGKLNEGTWGCLLCSKKFGRGYKHCRKNKLNFE